MVINVNMSFAIKLSYNRSDGASVRGHRSLGFGQWQANLIIFQGGATISKKQWVITIASIIFDIIVVSMVFMLIYAYWYEYSAMNNVTLLVAMVGTITIARIIANKELLKK